MESASALKAVEALVLLVAGGLFVWWQFRDLRREREKSLAKRHAVSRAEAAPDKEESAS